MIGVLGVPAHALLSILDTVGGWRGDWLLVEMEVGIGWVRWTFRGLHDSSFLTKANESAISDRTNIVCVEWTDARLCGWGVGKLNGAISHRSWKAFLAALREAARWPADSALGDRVWIVWTDDPKTDSSKGETFSLSLDDTTRWGEGPEGIDHLTLISPPTLRAEPVRDNEFDLSGAMCTEMAAWPTDALLSLLAHIAPWRARDHAKVTDRLFVCPLSVPTQWSVTDGHALIRVPLAHAPSSPALAHIDRAWDRSVGGRTSSVGRVPPSLSVPGSAVEMALRFQSAWASSPESVFGPSPRTKRKAATLLQDLVPCFPPPTIPLLVWSRPSAREAWSESGWEDYRCDLPKEMQDPSERWIGWCLSLAEGVRVSVAWEGLPLDVTGIDPEYSANHLPRFTVALPPATLEVLRALEAASLVRLHAEDKTTRARAGKKREDRTHKATVEGLAVEGVEGGKGIVTPAGEGITAPAGVAHTPSFGPTASIEQMRKGVARKESFSGVVSFVPWIESHHSHSSLPSYHVPRVSPRLDPLTLFLPPSTQSVPEAFLPDGVRMCVYLKEGRSYGKVATDPQRVHLPDMQFPVEFFQMHTMTTRPNLESGGEWRDDSDFHSVLGLGFLVEVLTRMASFAKMPASLCVEDGSAFVMRSYGVMSPMRITIGRHALPRPTPKDGGAVRWVADSQGTPVHQAIRVGRRVEESVVALLMGIRFNMRNGKMARPTTLPMPTLSTRLSPSEIAEVSLMAGRMWSEDAPWRVVMDANAWVVPIEPTAPDDLASFSPWYAPVPPPLEPSEEERQSRAWSLEVEASHLRTRRKVDEVSSAWEVSTSSPSPSSPSSASSAPSSPSSPSASLPVSSPPVRRKASTRKAKTSPSASSPPSTPSSPPSSYKASEGEEGLAMYVAAIDKVLIDKYGITLGDCEDVPIRYAYGERLSVESAIEYFEEYSDTLIMAKRMFASIK